MIYEYFILSLSCITVTTLKSANRLKKEGMGVDAENSSHKKKSILNLTEMLKQPKHMNKNDIFLVGPTRQPFTHMYRGHISLGTMLSLGQFFLKIFFIYFWRQGKGGKKREKHQYVTEPSIHYLLHSYAPNWGLGPQPRRVP